MDKGKLMEIYGGVDVVRCQNNSKSEMPGSVRVSPSVRGNRAGLNGTGNILVIDIDTKNDADIATLFATFPGIKATPTVQIKTASVNGLHLVYKLPEDFRIRKTRSQQQGAAGGNLYLCKGVEIPRRYMLPGSRINGVEYAQTNDAPLADCPPDVLVAVANDVVDLDLLQDAPPLPDMEQDKKQQVEAFLNEWREAGDGERHEVYLRVAYPLKNLINDDDVFMDLMERHYSGNDDAMLRAWLKSTVETDSSGWTPRPRGARKISKTRDRVLKALVNETLYLPWRGRTASTDRRVFLAIAIRSWRFNELSVTYPVESIATDLAVWPDTVRESLRRLEKAGKISQPFPGDAPRVHGLTCFEIVGYLNEGEYPHRDTLLEGIDIDGPIGPLDLVWGCDGLTGRHSQVFDLVQSGVSKQAEISRRSGASAGTVSSVAKDLAKVGLLHRDNGGAWRVADGAASVAAELKIARGAYERQRRISESISEDHDRLARFEAEIARDPERERAETDQELLRQMGAE